MSDFQLRLQPVASWPVVIAVAVVLVGLLWVRPRHVRLGVLPVGGAGRPATGRRAADAVAMLRPTLVYTKVEPQQASLVLLVDGSRSMQVADSLGDQSRWDAMKVLLEAAAPDIGKLGRNVGREGLSSSPTTSRKLDVRGGQTCRSRRNRKASNRPWVRRSTTRSIAKRAAACWACCS